MYKASMNMMMLAKKNFLSNDFMLGGLIYTVINVQSKINQN